MFRESTAPKDRKMNKIFPKLKRSAISQLFFAAITFLFNCIIISRDWHRNAVKNRALKRPRLHRWEIHSANSVVLLRAPIYTWKIRTAHERAHSSRSQPDDRPKEIHKIKIYLVSLRCDDNNIDTNNSNNNRDQRGAEERNNNSFKIKIHCVASSHRRLNVLIRAVKCRIFFREKKPTRNAPSLKIIPRRNARRTDENINKPMKWKNREEEQRMKSEVQEHTTRTSASIGRSSKRWDFDLNLFYVRHLTCDSKHFYSFRTELSQ